LKRFSIFILIFILFKLNCFAQKGGIPLAEEYYSAGEYLKAKSIFENFVSDLGNAQKVYEKYLDCFLKLKDYDGAEKFIKKMQKLEPSNYNYRVEGAAIARLQNKNSEVKKVIEKLIKEASQKPENINSITEALSKKDFFEATKEIYLRARAAQDNDFLYTIELAEIFKREKNTELMITELIRVLVLNQNDKELLKAKFQDFITTDEEFNKFQEIIIERIQANPDQYVYNDLLIWVYVQKRDFYRAFIQAKAYDKLLKLQGNKVVEVAKIALENKYFDDCIEMFDYVAKEYKNTPNYVLARKYKIQAKEELIKSKFPVENTTIRSLISDYKVLTQELGRGPQVLEPQRSMAVLYGFYLDSKDTAKAILNEIIKSPYADPVFLAKCKLDLGDIYLLSGEHWEATLLYSQVEKSQKEAPLGHEAKLRNAKLSYFTGQFEFAQEHLDVLKLATTREIANDAMDLSLFIVDNIGMDSDSTHAALQKYANIELLIFQNKYLEAQKSLDSMLINYKGHSLNDEIYFLQATILQKLGKYDEAISKLEAIVNLFKTDIYGDDAAYLLAKIYDENLHDEKKAMDLYNNFLVTFPSSIYTAEARKRFRALRGDNLN
jgi:tetratricopeptide (TPR) repeat protein